MDFINKPLPSSEEAEQTILAGVLLNNDLMRIALSHVTPEDFYNPRFRVIFKAMIKMWEVDDEIDPISLGEQIKRKGKIESVGGIAGLTHLTYGIPHFTDDNYKSRCELVKKHSIARKYIFTCNTIINNVLNDETQIVEIAKEAEEKIMGLNTALVSETIARPETGFMSLAEIVPRLREQFIAYNQGISNGISTGMTELDNLLDGGGFQRNAVYLVAASEKAGKTSLVLDWADAIALTDKYTVPIVTLEMSKLTMGKRMFSKYTGIPYYMFRPGFSDSGQLKAFSNAMNELENFGKLPIHIADDLFGFSQIERYLTRMCEVGERIQKPVVFAILDYLQLIGVNPNGSTTREQDVSKISREIRKLAQNLNIGIGIISSMNRIGMVDGWIPTTLNLRDSQQLAYDAEAVMFLHNPAYVIGKPYTPKPITDINLILDRQRNGPTGTIKLKFIGKSMTFMTEAQFREEYGTDDDATGFGETRKQDDKTQALWDEDDEEDF